MQEKRKYSKEEMYLAIELWQESGLTQQQFCNREKLSVKTFGYWIKKYRQEGAEGSPTPESDNGFIPVELPGTVELPPAGTDLIGITYPDGTRVTCPVNIGIQQLKTLIHP